MCELCLKTKTKQIFVGHEQNAEKGVVQLKKPQNKMLNVKWMGFVVWSH